jgi:ABC-type transport system substrate-binding protein
VAGLPDFLWERHRGGLDRSQEVHRESRRRGLQKAPIAPGPYKFVSFTPGVELVFEANEQYWRKAPSVKRLVFKVIPDEATRLAALKGGEVTSFTRYAASLPRSSSARRASP